MIVKAIHVQTFRSILDERIDCDNLTVLVGRNGTRVINRVVTKLWPNLFSARAAVSK